MLYSARIQGATNNRIFRRAPARSLSKDPLRCSFCSKQQDEVAVLIAGPTSYICNECLDICVEIYRDKAQAEKVPLDTFLPRLSQAEGALGDFESSRKA